MNYKIKIHKRVEKYLSKLPENTKSNIIHHLKKLESGKWDLLDIKNMQGEWTGYKRFRIGNLRVIFEVKDNIIFIDYIGARGDVYK